MKPSTLFFFVPALVVADSFNPFQTMAEFTSTTYVPLNYFFFHSLKRFFLTEIKPFVRGETNFVNIGNEGGTTCRNWNTLFGGNPSPGFNCAQAFGSKFWRKRIIFVYD